MSLAQIFSTFLILGLLKYEKFTLQTVFGAFVMIAGAVLVLWKGNTGFDIGALMVCLSFFFTPIGNLFQKRLREKNASVIFLFYRNIAIFFFFGGLFLIFEKPDFQTQYSLNSWLIFLALYGFFFWYIEKQFWTETLHRMPITKASLLMILAPPMTIVFAYFALNEIPSKTQLLGFIPIAIGAYLVLKKEGFVILKR
jgi:drug/metabolite transporter (DMT)-like permease